MNVDEDSNEALLVSPYCLSTSRLNLSIKLMYDSADKTIEGQTHPPFGFIQLDCRISIAQGDCDGFLYWFGVLLW